MIVFLTLVYVAVLAVLVKVGVLKWTMKVKASIGVWFVLLLVFFVANKWEKVGGILFILIGVALSPPVFSLNYRMNESVGMSLGIVAALTGPFVIVGILFVISSKLKRNNRARDSRPSA